MYAVRTNMNVPPLGIDSKHRLQLSYLNWKVSFDISKKGGVGEVIWEILELVCGRKS